VFESTEQRVGYCSALLHRTPHDRCNSYRPNIRARVVRAGLLTWLVDGVKPPTHWEDGPGGRAQELKDGVAAVLALLGSLAKGRGDLDKAWSAEQTNAILSLLLTITQEGLGPERTGDAQEQDAWDQTHVAGQLLHAWCTLIPFGTPQQRRRCSWALKKSHLCGFVWHRLGLRVRGRRRLRRRGAAWLHTTNLGDVCHTARQPAERR